MASELAAKAKRNGEARRFFNFYLSTVAVWTHKLHLLRYSYYISYIYIYMNPIIDAPVPYVHVLAA